MNGSGRLSHHISSSIGAEKQMLACALCGFYFVAVIVRNDVLKRVVLDNEALRLIEIIGAALSVAAV